MTEVYKHPFQILTTYLSFYEVWVDPDDPEAVLWGLYGDLITGEYKEIRVEMDFDTLNTLISGVDDYQDSAVSFLCDGIITPPDGNGIIDLSESGGLVFWDHIFSLVLIAEVDELGEIVETEEMAYRLIAYVPRKDVVPQ